MLQTGDDGFLDWPGVSRYIIDRLKIYFGEKTIKLDDKDNYDEFKDPYLLGDTWEPEIK